MNERQLDVEDRDYDLAGLALVSSYSVRTLRGLIHQAVDPLPARRLGRRGKWTVRNSEYRTWQGRQSRAAATLDAIVDGVLRELKGGDRGKAGAVRVVARRPR